MLTGASQPKTKGFARIRAALAEETAPVDADVRREAEVVRQVRESDMDLELRIPPPTALSSPTTMSMGFATIFTIAYFPVFEITQSIPDHCYP